MQVTKADGRKIRALREAADLTVDELVNALAKRGLKRHPDTIRNIELGHTKAGFKLVNALVPIFGCDRADLLVDEDDRVDA